MTRERIEDMREVVLPFVKKRLLETNYEGLGEADAKEFEREFNEILNLAIKALEQEPCEDAVSRQEVLDLIADYDLSMGQVVRGIHALPSVTPQEPRWIPVSERLPKDLEPVNITWINHDPEPYYNDIKDKPFTATGVYFNGQWYWWSTLCTDILAEYSHNYDDIIDDAIEITAWMPLPKSYSEVEK